MLLALSKPFNQISGPVPPHPLVPHTLVPPDVPVNHHKERFLFSLQGQASGENFSHPGKSVIAGRGRRQRSRVLKFFEKKTVVAPIFTRNSALLTQVQITRESGVQTTNPFSWRNKKQKYPLVGNLQLHLQPPRNSMGRRG